MWALDPDCLGSNPDFTYNYLHEVSKWLKFSVSWFYHPLNGNTNSTYYIGILWGLNEVTYVMCLHLAPGKCWISISYFSSQIHSLESIFQKTQSIVWRLSIPNHNQCLQKEFPGLQIWHRRSHTWEGTYAGEDGVCGAREGPDRPDQGQASFFCKGPNSHDFKLFWPYHRNSASIVTAATDDTYLIMAVLK